MNDSASESPSWGLVLVRLSIGAILTMMGWQKILEGFGAEAVLATRARVAEAPVWFESFANATVYRFPETAAQLLQWGQLGAGIALFLGALTRPAGFFAGLTMIACSLAVAPHQMPFDLLLAVCAFACALSRAGRRVGLDSIFDGHFPAWISWTRAAA